MIGRERCVGERGGVARVEAAERHERARRWDEHVLGHGAVAAEPAAARLHLRGAQAAVLHAARAVAAEAAAPRTIDGDRLAHHDPLYARTDSGDPAGRLMPERGG